MSYHIAEPNKSNITEHDTLIWYEGDFKAYEWQGRITMHYKGYDIGTLIGGRKVLASRYKNSFENWIDSLREKDLAKIEHTRELCQEALDTCNMIENLWTK